MKTFRLYVFALLALPIIASSCKKDDDDDDNNVAGTCKPVKAYLYDTQNGQIEDSVSYTYTGDQVTKLDVPGSGFVNLEYANGRVTKRTMFDYTAPTVSTGHEIITYNADGTLQKIDYYTNNPGAVKYRTATLSYSAGKYNKLTITEDDGTGNFATIEEYVYTYTGNNITGVVVTDFTATPADTYNYSYSFDTNTNYFTKQNTQFMFTDPFFGEFDGTLLPMLVSANNATSISVMGVPFAQFSYEVDSKGNISKVKFGGNTLVGYNYQCP